MTWTSYQDLTKKERDIAWAAATDQGNRHMRANGRSKWNEDDWNAAVKELSRLLD